MGLTPSESGEGPRRASGLCQACFMLMFVPLSRAELAEWATAGPRDVSGYAATQEFLNAFGISDPLAEETELTLLEISALEGLIRHGVRLVAVCDGAPVPSAAEERAAAEFGAVTASSVPWSQVSSIFTDDTESARRASLTGAELGTTTVADVWDLEPVQTLIEETDLLWHGASEWERLSD